MDRIKRLSMEILEEHKDEFGTDFAENKKILDGISIVRSKGLKNELAGFITKFIKRELREKKEKEEQLQKEAQVTKESDESVETIEVSSEPSQTTESSEVIVEDESVMKPEPRVPVWVQSTGQHWIDGAVSDREFTDALGFLVNERIIDVEVAPPLEEIDDLVDEEPQVPTSTEWWINGDVPEDQFLEGIKWMIEHQLIRGLGSN